jgi:hypothetical protein
VGVDVEHLRGHKGVEFLLNKIAKIGPSNMHAFDCGPGCPDPNEDDVLPGQLVGKYVLTQKQGNNPPGVRITFKDPVGSFSANILDVERQEQWVITAFDSSGKPIDVVTIDKQKHSGEQTFFSFDHRPVKDIASVLFVGTDAGSFGFAMDNFSTTGICPAATFGSHPY